ncbi:hypothetical protein SKAU_G00333120 [Synaphobranchus kaupii]|uniref:Ig-like domain-containing protein n=1 Tax=Synaphobranchus kaupii TaxID=118154 RepID=A0A9Q1ELG7_SYNKA|nr:hypothetical protein SKAU_G00333120 [Synaphobranchus kaupii]
MVLDPNSPPPESSAISGLVVRGTWEGRGAAEGLWVVCVSSNRHGLEERNLTVYVKAPPTNVTVTQHPSRPSEGVGVTLSCTSQGFPPVSGYRWYGGQAGLEIGLEEESRDLRVATVTRGSGPYRCAARNEMGEASSPITWLNVEYAPDILPDSSCIMGNGQVRCECVVDANPAAQVTWTSVRSFNTSSTLSGRVLRSIVTVSLGDEGRHFYCNATNEHGDAFYRLTLTVGHLGKWAIVFGVAGGAVALCLLLGAIFYCKRTKSRQCKHIPSTDLTLKEEKRVVEEEVNMDCLYDNTGTVSPTYPPPEGTYELAKAPRESKRQLDSDEPLYTNV